jgi:hypothetical protein
MGIPEIDLKPFLVPQSMAELSSSRVGKGRGGDRHLNFFGHHLLD